MNFQRIVDRLRQWLTKTKALRDEELNVLARGRKKTTTVVDSDVATFRRDPHPKNGRTTEWKERRRGRRVFSPRRSVVIK